MSGQKELFDPGTETLPIDRSIGAVKPVLRKAATKVVVSRDRAAFYQPVTAFSRIGHDDDSSARFIDENQFRCRHFRLMVVPISTRLRNFLTILLLSAHHF